MFIDKDTLKRVNIDAVSHEFPYKSFSKLDTEYIRLAAGVIEIPDPVRPEDFSDDLHIWNELDLPPYFKITDRDPEQVAKTLATRERDAAQKFLDDTDYLFTNDRHAELIKDEPEREADMKLQRSNAREVVRAYKAKYQDAPLV